jgi:hypothetical protein
MDLVACLSYIVLQNQPAAWPRHKLFWTSLINAPASHFGPRLYASHVTPHTHKRMTAQKLRHQHTKAYTLASTKHTTCAHATHTQTNHELRYASNRRQTHAHTLANTKHSPTIYRRKQTQDPNPARFMPRVCVHILRPSATKQLMAKWSDAGCMGTRAIRNALISDRATTKRNSVHDTVLSTKVAADACFLVDVWSVSCRVGWCVVSIYLCTYICI